MNTRAATVNLGEIVSMYAGLEVHYKFVFADFFSTQFTL